MSKATNDISSFSGLFLHTLRDIYYAEKHIARFTPHMIEKAGTPELREALENHLAETENQVARLERVFGLLGEEPKGTMCEAINGILDESESIMGHVSNPDVLDAAMLAAAQAVEHYEITRYGTLYSWARELGREDCAWLLHESLEEERRADERLTMLGVSRINRKAA